MTREPADRTPSEPLEDLAIAVEGRSSVEESDLSADSAA